MPKRGAERTHLGAQIADHVGNIEGGVKRKVRWGLLTIEIDVGKEPARSSLLNGARNLESARYVVVPPSGLV
jgi:hypothetical protein